MTAEGNNMVMPVSPMYGGYGNGGGFGNWSSDIWIILIVLLIFGGGFGFGGFGGMGMGMLGMGGLGGMYEFPWLLASGANNQNATQRGFDNLATSNAINGLQSSVNNGFNNVQLGIAGINQNLCQTGNSVVAAVTGGFSQAEIAANTRQMANMQQVYGIQSQLAQASADNRLATANLGSDIAREACATRTSDTQNTQLILNAINDGFRAMSDQRYQDKIDAKNDEIAQLRQENLYARGQASQIGQNGEIVNAIYDRLKNCPVGSTPVYGNQPIFTCPQSYNMGCGCGCNNGF